MTEINDVQIAPKKPWYTSKTLWFNTAAAMLIALESSLHVIQPYVAGNVYAYGMMALVIINAGLRIITTQGLSK